MPTAQGNVNLQSPAIFRSWILCRTWKQNNLGSNLASLNRPSCCCSEAARSAPIRLVSIKLLPKLTSIRIGCRHFDRCHKCGVDRREPTGEPGRKIARVLGGRQYATPRSPASRFNRDQRRCNPSCHQSDARVRHHVIRRAAFLHAPSALPDVLAVTKGRPAQLL